MVGALGSWRSVFTCVAFYWKEIWKLWIYLRATHRNANKNARCIRSQHLPSIYVFMCTFVWWLPQMLHILFRFVFLVRRSISNEHRKINWFSLYKLRAFGIFGQISRFQDSLFDVYFCELNMLQYEKCLNSKWRKLLIFYIFLFPLNSDQFVCNHWTRIFNECRRSIKCFIFSWENKKAVFGSNRCFSTNVFSGRLWFMTIIRNTFKSLWIENNVFSDSCWLQWTKQNNKQLIMTHTTRKANWIWFEQRKCHSTR